ncbi:MAG: Ku protein [Methanomicrobiaceae archaeon]|nr:Ku protein [Methanomicrobiaceae archaeon]
MDPLHEHVKKAGRATDAQEIARLHPVWSGRLSLGLVNIPVKALPLVQDRRIRFRMMHRTCETPIHYKKVCEEGHGVPDEEVVFGYELPGGEHVLLEREELRNARPRSSQEISLDAFISVFEVDAHYFEKTYVLIPDGSEAAYALLRRVMQRAGKAAVGKATLHSRERVVLIHHYRNAIVATTLRYHDELLDPTDAPALEGLPEPDDEEIELAHQIVEKLSAPFDLAAYEDRYGARLEALIRARAGGRPLVLEEESREVSAKTLMEALRETALSLER